MSELMKTYTREDNLKLIRFDDTSDEDNEFQTDNEPEDEINKSPS